MTSDKFRIQKSCQKHQCQRHASESPAIVWISTPLKYYSLERRVVSSTHNSSQQYVYRTVSNFVTVDCLVFGSRFTSGNEHAKGTRVKPFRQTRGVHVSSKLRKYCKPSGELTYLRLLSVKGLRRDNIADWTTSRATPSRGKRFQ